MRHLLLWVLLVLPLLGQDPIIFGGKRGPVRSAAQGIWMVQNPNLFLQTADLTNAAWTATLANVSASIAAPDGSTTAFRLTATASSGYHRIQQSIAALVGDIRTVSVVAKAPSGSYLWISIDDSSVNSSTFDLQSGTVTATSTGNTDTVTSLGGGWYTVTTRRTMTTTGGAVRIGVTNAPTGTTSVTTTGTEYVDLWHPSNYGGSTALPYAPTTDAQSYPNLISGGAALQRGSTSGTDTSDPTRRGVGVLLDGIDDLVANIPAAGATYTKTFCSASECYTVDSAGNEYVNGAVRVNFRTWSENFNAGLWTLQNSAWIGGKLYENTATQYHRLKVDSVAGKTLVNPYVTITVKPDQESWTKVRLANEWVNFNLSTGAAGLTSSGSASGSCVAGAGGYYDCTAAFIGSFTVPTYFAIYVNRTDYNGLDEIFTGTNLYGLYLQHVQVATGLYPYQRTEGAAIPALGTSGGYTGLFTGWGQWSRIVGAGEIIRDYFRWWRPRINAAGGTLP